MNTLEREKPIRLLLVEDNNITLLGLRTMLGGYRQFEIAGEAGTVLDAMKESQRLKPDVTLLDLRLKDGSGIEVCRRMQAEGSETKILVLSSFADDRLVLDALSAGADGYLLKEIDGDGLVRAIESVASGRSVLDPAITAHVINRARSAGSPSEQDKLNHLSPQERRVVALVAEGKTNKEIGQEMRLSDKTVKNYLSNAMDKLKLTRRSQAAALYVTHSKAP